MRLKSKISKEIRIGNVAVGGDNPVVIQSMTNTATKDVQATIEQIDKLAKAGCQVIRVAVPDEESAKAIAAIKSKSNLPLIADIHFDYKLALLSIENGIDKLRLNPGNIGESWKVREVAKAAKNANIPIRVGVNWGSVPTKVKQQYAQCPEEAMIALAEREIETLLDCNFEDVIVSLKCFELPLLLKANRMFSERFDYPLHIGVTEAGLPEDGIIRSAVGIGALLSEGIGDTIRVSLTGDPIAEIAVCKKILESLDLIKHKGISYVSCPTCARTKVDVENIAKSVKQRLKDYDAEIKIAIMGCEVNGPGEAKEADIGLAGGKGYGVIFRNGKILERVDEDKLLDVFVERVIALLEK